MEKQIPFDEEIKIFLRVLAITCIFVPQIRVNGVFGAVFSYD